VKEEGRLSGAVGAEEGDRPPPLYGEADTVEGSCPVGVAVAEILDLDGVFAQRIIPSVAA
jgi:hypothetical protein